MVSRRHILFIMSSCGKWVISKPPMPLTTTMEETGKKQGKNGRNSREKTRLKPSGSFPYSQNLPTLLHFLLQSFTSLTFTQSFLPGAPLSKATFQVLKVFLYLLSSLCSFHNRRVPVGAVAKWLKSWADLPLTTASPHPGVMGTWQPQWWRWFEFLSPSG